MIGAATVPVGGTASAVGSAMRRSTLLLAMLLSGGNLIIPRAPVLGLFLILAGIAFAAMPPARQREPMLPILGLLGLVLLANVYRSGFADVSALVIRYANFAAGMALLSLYLRAGRSAFIHDYSVIGLPLSWISIITVVLSLVVLPLFQQIEVQETTYHHIFYIFNFHLTIEDAGGLMRPNGPFFEPGVFQIYLNVFLYISLFVTKRYRQAVVAVVAVAATQSTTGVVIASGLVALFFLRLMSRGSIHRRTAILVLAVLTALMAAGPIIQNVQSKLVGDFAGSGMARQFDLITGINVVLAHPVAGIGFDPETYRQLSGAYAFEDTLLGDRITEDRGNTNGVLVVLYSVGIPLGAVFLWGLLRQTMLPDRLLVGGMLLLSLMTESIFFTPFFLMFTFSGLLLRARPIRKGRRRPIRLPLAADALP